jgi:hypothetical protein
MADAIATYQNALREVKRTSQEAERIAKAIEAAGRAMAHWRDVTVSNAPGGGGYPANLIGPGRPSIDASRWPTAEDIHKALVAYHAAQSVALAAWSAIPATDRIGLTPPDPN